MSYDDYGLYEDFDLAGVTHRMRWIKPGTFMMGSPENELERFVNESLHRVTLTKGFWLAETACTQAAWTAVMGKNPSRFKGNDRPVEQVSWNDCQEFLGRLSAILSGEGPPVRTGFRLPTEAEWEYACRAGTTTSFWFGDKITAEQVNHVCNDKGRGETVDVKALPCNAWGLYQMHGNVWEWCQDYLGNYPNGPAEDPVGVKWSSCRVVRGGSWHGNARRCRSACRDICPPDIGLGIVSFRLARSLLTW